MVYRFLLRNQFHPVFCRKADTDLNFQVFENYYFIQVLRVQLKKSGCGDLLSKNQDLKAEAIPCFNREMFMDLEKVKLLNF